MNATHLSNREASGTVLMKKHQTIFIPQIIIWSQKNKCQMECTVLIDYKEFIEGWKKVKLNVVFNKDFDLSL